MTLDARTIEKLAKVGLTVMRRDAHAPSSTVPLFISKVAAGMPSPAEDYVEKTLDLNEYCLPHSEASFFLKVSGNSMTGRLFMMEIFSWWIAVFPLKAARWSLQCWMGN